VIPVAYWNKTDLNIAGLGNVLTNISYFIPKARLCFNSYCLDLKFFIADIPIACILGTPFFAAVSPHGSTQISPEQSRYFITLGKETIVKLPFISIPKCTNDVEINLLKAQRMQEMKSTITSLKIETQLQTSLFKAKIESLRKMFAETACSELPTAFWNQRKHIVYFPYKENYAGTLCKSRTIPMNAEYQKLCAEEIQSLLERGLIRKSTSPWNCYGFYVNKHSE